MDYSDLVVFFIRICIYKTFAIGKHYNTYRVKIAAGQGARGLVWTLLVFGVLAQITTSEFEDKYVDREDLAYYASTSYTVYLQYNYFFLKRFVPTLSPNTKADKSFYQCGFTLIIILCRYIAHNPCPIKHSCRLCYKPVKNNQRPIQCEDCFF